VKPERSVTRKTSVYKKICLKFNCDLWRPFQPGCFMNCSRETVKMGLPPGNRPAVPRDWSWGVPDRYVAEWACPPSLRSGQVPSSKEHPRTPGRTVRYTVAAGNLWNIRVQ
jgi:hypothetical protein